MSVKNIQKAELTKLLFFALALLCMVLIKELPFGESVRIIGDAELTKSGQAALGILVFTIILWMTEAIPFHITGLLSMVLLALFRVESFRQIVNVGFGNDTIVFFIGVLILSAFITASGLGRRIGVWILSKTGNSTSMIILGFIMAGTLLSMWVTEMAAAAMLTPLAVSILREEHIEPLTSNFGRALMIGCAWGCAFGGVGTPSGSGTNPLAIGFIREMAGVEISYGQWMIYGIPVSLCMMPAGWLVLRLFFKPEMSHLSKSKEELKEELTSLPKMGREEKVTLILFVVTVLLWIATPLLETWLGIAIPISMPVLFTSCLFFLPKVSTISWKEIESKISWSGIILIVSGISLGMMLYNSGAAKWLSVVLLSGIGNLPSYLMVLVIVLMISLIKIIFSSNTVTATIIIPIIIELATSLGIPVMAVAIPASLVSALAFILVTSSPTNVIPYSAGYFSIADFAKAGLLMTLVGSIILSSVVFLVGNLTGIY